MSKNNIIGKKFGRLTVKKYIHRKWLCICDCGNEVEVFKRYLIKGSVKSCGCFRSDMSRKKISQVRDIDKFNGTKISLLTKKKQINNTSGITGVYWNKERNKWKSIIQLNNKQKFLGYFDTKKEAIKARKDAEKNYFEPIIKQFNELQQ